MLPSADFEDGLKEYNNSMLCKHVGQSPALRPLSLNQPSRKIPKPEQRVVSVQLATPTLDLDERSPSYCAQGTTLRYTIFTND